MAFITQDEDKKKLRTLKDVKRDLRDTVKSSRKYTPKERENKAKLYKELTDMGGKSKHAPYWKKFLPKKFSLKKQNKSVDLEGVHPEIREKLKSDIEAWNKIKGNKKIPSLIVSSGYRSKKTNDALVEKEIKRSIDFIGDATEEEKKILREGIGRVDGQGNPVKGKQSYLDRIRALNISQDRKNKLEKALGSAKRGRERVSPTSGHQEGLKLDIARGQLSTKAQNFLKERGWKTHHSAGSQGLVDLQLDPSKDGAVDTIGKLTSRLAMEEAEKKGMKFARVGDPASLERSPDVPTRPSLPEDPLAPKPYPDEGQETENITNAIEAVHGTSQFSGKADKGISFQEEPLDSIQIEAAKEHMGAKNAPPEMRDQAGKELKNPQEQKRIKEQSKVGGNVTPMDQLKEALLYFGPQIAASILGGAEAGEATSRIMEGVRKHSLEKEKLAIERESKLGQKGIASENLTIKKANLAARLAEIEDQRKRTNNLQEDRRLRKAERELNREKKYLDFTDKQKEMFSNRNDVKTYRERKNKYQAILNLTNFKEGQQLPGGINALIARSVSGEVGVLTDADVQRAQINPDLISKLKRGYFTNIRGTMSPKDTEDIKLLVRKIMAKDDEIMKEKAGLYTQAKKKWLPEKYQKSFKEDLITGGLGIDITKKVKPKLTPDQRKRLEYLRAKHRK
mgnify:CR=1 FL=1|tara:strand:+ start:11631 stop:13667 length:2037 start_codon:yes stop_codon:yes gene_type:complete